jgi:hypothetical protein
MRRGQRENIVGMFSLETMVIQQIATMDGDLATDYVLNNVLHQNNCDFASFI